MLIPTLMNSNSILSKASWIAAPFAGSPRSSVPAPYLRKSFQLGKPVQSARLAITALGLVECEINGRVVGDEIFAPGWTDYNKRVQYQTYDVTAFLHPGENVIGAILGDGWYCGYVAWMDRQIYGDRPRLLASLEVVFTDGSAQIMSSDSSWKTIAGPILESDFLTGEVYDARKELGPWSEPGYEDAGWLAVLVMESPEGMELVPRLGPPVRRIEELAPKGFKEKESWPKNVRIFDFGQNFSGRVRADIRAREGTTARFRFAEVLSPDGHIYTDNLRGIRAADAYTCKGDGLETWEPRFTFHGFRYVEVGGLDPGDSVELTGIVLHSDTPPAGSFHCSHELLNQLQQNIVWGQKSNFLEVPTDCPQRDERLGWTGDAQVFVRTACFNRDVRGFFHKWMGDFRDAQTAEGAIPGVIPDAGFLHGSDGGPAWADATIICPWTIYLCYGDRDILEEHYDSMGRYMDFVATKCCVGKIRSHPNLDGWLGYGDWLALDGSGRVDGGTPRDLIGTAFYARVAEIMGQIAAVLGRDADAKQYRDLHCEIVLAFQRRFVTEEGLVVSGTQTSYVLALHFGLIPERLRPIAAAELVRDVKRRDDHLATGFVGTPYLLDVLEANGYLEVAYKLLEQETFPSWLFPVKNGATTIWERWDGWTPEKGFQDKGMNSFNHYAYGAVGDWMYHTVAGLQLDPEAPGYRHILFRPRPGGSIQWAEAKLLLATGEAAIKWELKGDALHIHVEIPEGSEATVDLPEGFFADVSRLGPGRHRIVATKQGKPVEISAFESFPMPDGIEVSLV